MEDQSIMKVRFGFIGLGLGHVSVSLSGCVFSLDPINENQSDKRYVTAT